MVTTAQIESDTAASGDFRREMGRVSRHSAVFFAGTIFTAATGYVFKIYLARNLGAEALGIFTLGMTIIGFVGVFSGLGLVQAAVRFIPNYIATGKLDLLRGFVIRSVLLLLACNMLVAAGLVLSGNLIAVHLYHAPALSQYVPLFAGLMIMTALNAFLAQVLAGFRHVARRTVITNFVGSPAMMVVAVILIMSGLQLRGYILAQAIGAVVVLGLLVVSCWKLMPGPARAFGAPVPSLQRDVGIFSATVSGMNLLEFVIAQSDKVLIGIFLTTRDLGIYAMAAGLVTFVSIILQSVNQIFSPTIAGLHAKRDYVLLGRM